MEKVIVHEIPVWKDPNSSLIVEFIRDEFFCFFKCLDRETYGKGIDKEEDFLGVFHALNLLEIKHKRYTKELLFPTDVDHDHIGYYYEIDNSLWLKEALAYKDREEPDWKNYDKSNYKHYIFENNKYWVEIIASEISFKKAKKANHNDKIKLWETV